ncbi:MAG: PLP-dependent aminotransferase family protein [Thiofilum sp.]|uniref:aminotransferase-like domain-containing protein n=1 Tax=Thiofilum sp. TaxID=2212733 RepID=UPI0025FE3C31|nr:PLP-dependent aminotransferase family protein [Thiofilum sp.]MBK8455409.1 PLP-dependent aminotransferase family protein [Thiofilum sp.]
MKLYESIADTLRERIEQGFYKVGDKSPSVRILSAERKVSLATAQQALWLLEQQQYVEVKAKSGFYVKAPQSATSIPQISRLTQYPLEVSQWDEVLALLSCREQPNILNLGRGLCDVTVPTLKPLMRLLSDNIKSRGQQLLAYDSLPGQLALRDQIARLGIVSGTQIQAQDLIITTGCQEALSISIQAVTKPGDVVAIESPCFYGVMQILNAHGLKALEIPTHPTHGMSLEALEMALDQWPIRAIMAIPAFNNPLGSCMPDANKQRLLQLAQHYDVPIIEDDIYGELAYKQPRPRTIQSFDQEGRVILCSSFTKTVAVGLRVGWIVPGRYRNRILHLKYVGTASAVSMTQLAIADFIEQGYFERHLRKVRQQYQMGRDVAIRLIKESFPDGTRISFPEGGFIIWVELPHGFDAVQLDKRMMQHHIKITSGSVFSASGKYRNCIRINYTRAALDEKIQAAIQLVGKEAQQLMNSF